MPAVRAYTTSRNPGPIVGMGWNRSYNTGRAGRRVEYWLNAGGLSGREKQIGEELGTSRMPLESIGEVGVEILDGNVASGDNGRWSVKWEALRLIGPYKNEGRIDGGGGLCHCVEFQVRPTCDH